jgi:fatty acid desaturase
MFSLSLLMLGSMHAVKVTHLLHHRRCMSDEDVEAASARMSAVKAILVGPLFPVRLHRAALRAASPRERRWIHAELMAGAAWVRLALGLLELKPLRYHILAMAAGQCLTAFFAVWTVHHDCDRLRFIARTLRGRLNNVISFNMFLHVEHHLYPRVPTCHLARMAERLDAAVPELQQKRVF